MSHSIMFIHMWLFFVRKMCTFLIFIFLPNNWYPNNSAQGSSILEPMYGPLWAVPNWYFSPSFEFSYPTSFAIENQFFITTTWHSFNLDEFPFINYRHLCFPLERFQHNIDLGRPFDWYRPFNLNVPPFVSGGPFFVCHVTSSLDFIIWMVQTP